MTKEQNDDRFDLRSSRLALITGCGNSTSTGTAAKTDNGQAADGAYDMAYVVSIETNGWAS